GKGSCGAKHYLLAEMFRLLNIPVVYATFPFLWNDPDLDYPPDIRNLAATLPVAHHLACRVQIGCSWILVDATWDLPLAKAGFPVNEHWDGYSKTKCAVKPLKSPVRTAFCRTATNEPCRDKDEAALTPVDGEKNHWEKGARDRYYSGKIALRSSEEIVRVRQFSREFSSWLESLRTSV
ncbi:MAG: transglutaminase domain-containing protein, partial [Methanoregula sp.]|nr:transglutaminase domain-containing protein [Methanoregula sp.]